MGWFKRLWLLLALLISSLTGAYSSILYTRPFKGIVGNLCDKTSENPMGDCYEMLPSGGFPFTFMWDNAGVSVVGRLSLIEDKFVLYPFLANWVFYFVLIVSVVWGYNRLKQKVL